MACKFICDGCGVEAPATYNGMHDPMKPREWFMRADDDGRQDACSERCIQMIAARTGKTSCVNPMGRL